MQANKQTNPAVKCQYDYPKEECSNTCNRKPRPQSRTTLLTSVSNSQALGAPFEGQHK